MKFHRGMLCYSLFSIRTDSCQILGLSRSHHKSTWYRILSHPYLEAAWLVLSPRGVSPRSQSGHKYPGVEIHDILGKETKSCYR